MKFNIPEISSNIVIHPMVWRFLGFLSSIVGFSCYALSSSCHDLFGHWNLLKIVSYSIPSFIFSVLMLFVDNCPKFISRGFWLRTHVGFLVLMLTSLYSFYEDRSRQGKDEKGYRSILSLVSFGAFALMSVSLSRQIQPELDVGMSNFFLGCLIVSVMKMNVKIALGVAVLFQALITIRSYWDSQMRLPDDGDTERAITGLGNSQLTDKQSLANNGHEEADSHIGTQSLGTNGHKESDNIDHTDGNTVVHMHNRGGDIQEILIHVPSLELANEMKNGDQETNDSNIDPVDSLHQETSAIHSPLSIYPSHSTLTRRFKLVLKLDLHNDRARQKASKIVSRLIGVESVAMDIKENKLSVVGDIDPVLVVSKIRKHCHAEILSEGPAGLPEKKIDEDKKKEV